eukprot:RCo037514
MLFEWRSSALWRGSSRRTRPNAAARPQLCGGWARKPQRNMPRHKKSCLSPLRDECPRCGESFEGYPDEEEQRRHLRECTDSRKAVQYKQRLQEQEQRVKVAEKVHSAQHDAAALAAFQLLGG